MSEVGKESNAPQALPLLLLHVRGLRRTHSISPGGGWLLTLGVPVTQRRRPHVTQPDCAFAAAVHEGVAVVGVELGRRDHLRELLHVGWLDVHDIWHRRVKEGTTGRGASAVTKHCRFI